MLETHQPAASITCITFIFIVFIMNCVLFLLCGALTSVLCCDWLHQYHHLSGVCRTNLHLMGGELTKHDSPVPVPYKLYKHVKNATVESQLVFIRDSLELIAGLYNHTSVPWDTERLLMSIHRQIDELNSCVSTERRADSRLRKYYRRLLKSTVTRSGGSRASWELIRKQSELNLDQLDLLVSFILNSTAPPQRH